MAAITLLPPEIRLRIISFVDQPTDLSRVCKVFHQTVNDAVFTLPKLIAVLIEKYQFDAVTLESLFADQKEAAEKISYVAQRLMELPLSSPESPFPSHYIPRLIYPLILPPGAKSTKPPIPNHLLPVFARQLYDRYSQRLTGYEHRLQNAFDSRDLLKIELLLQPFFTALRQNPDIGTITRGNSFLTLAAQQNLLRTVNQMLAYPALDEGSTAAVQAAAERGYLDIVNTFLDESRLKEKCVLNLCSGLQAASCHGQQKIAKTIFAHPRFDEISAPSFFEALRKAAEAGHATVVALFLNHPQFEQLSDLFLQAVLSAAAANGQLHAMCLILNKLKNKKTLSLSPVLQAAAKGGSHLQSSGKKEDYVKITKMLLRDPRTHDFAAALYIALVHHQADIAQFILIDARFDKEATDGVNLVKALSQAISNHYTQIATTLLSNPRIEYLGHALVMAAESNESKLLQAILNDPRVEKIPHRQRKLSDVLVEASNKRKIDVVKVLLEHPRAKEIPASDLRSVANNLHSYKEIRERMDSLIGPPLKRQRI